MKSTKTSSPSPAAVMPVITSVLWHGPFTPAWHLTYDIIAKNVPAVTSLIHKPPKGLKAQVDTKGFKGKGAKFFLNCTYTVAATGAIWREKVQQMAKAHPRVSKSAITVMRWCRADGVIVRTSHDVRYCRKHFVCPYCWHRRVVKICSRMIQLSQQYTYCTQIEIKVYNNANCWYADAAYLNRLIDTVRDGRNFAATAVLRRPLPSPTGGYTPAALVIGFSNSMPTTAPAIPVQTQDHCNAVVSERTIATTAPMIYSDLLQYDPTVLFDSENLYQVRQYSGTIRSRNMGTW